MVSGAGKNAVGAGMVLVGIRKRYAKLCRESKLYPQPAGTFGRRSGRYTG
jgi:hypothetical protein